MGILCQGGRSDHYRNQMTMQTGGTWTGSMKSAGDDKAEQFGGTWVSQGGSTYHINETQSYNSEFDVTLPSGRQY